MLTETHRRAAQFSQLLHGDQKLSARSDRTENSIINGDRDIFSGGSGRAFAGRKSRISEPPGGSDPPDGNICDQSASDNLQRKAQAGDYADRAPCCAALRTPAPPSRGHKPAKDSGSRRRARAPLTALAASTG